MIAIKSAWHKTKFDMIIACSAQDFENNARFYHQSFSERTFHPMLHLLKEEMQSQLLVPEEMQKQTADKSNIVETCLESSKGYILRSLLLLY